MCTRLERSCKAHLLPSGASGSWFPQGRLTLSEVMTIVIRFHLSGYWCFKRYYQKCVYKQLAGYFPRLVSYNRFVELMSYSALPLALYTRLLRREKPTGVGFIDSTPLQVCHNRRIYQHKVFTGYAERGKSSTGWFYGFKLHLIINDRGDISQERFERLYRQGIKLITRLKKHMKNTLMDMEDKRLLRKRAVIESVNDVLKNICPVEHTRHRSLVNFLVNRFGALSAYRFLPHKPSISGVYDNLMLPMPA